MRKIWYLGASRVELPHQIQIGVTPPYVNWQPLNPDGSNVIAYLLERFTSRDPRWADAENWLKRITPEISVLKVPLRAMQASVETTDASLGLDINMAYQGTGVQEALSIIAALVFSPEGSTIIVEEPETNLHARSQEGLVDLINLAVRDWKKQVIFTTHSWDMLHPFSSDIGEGKERGQSHVKAKSENFKLIVFNRIGAEVKISDLKIEGMPYMKLRDYLKGLWG
jgi:predicted ATPase